MKFAEVLEIKNGKNQKQVENADGKYPIYGSGGIMGWATDYICPAETVIIGRKGTINNPIYVDTPFWNVDTAFGLVADKRILHPKYLYYFCKHFDFLALNTTVTIPSLTKANLLKIDIPVPDIDEQRYIVGVLDDVEKLIEIKTNEKVELDNLVKSRFIEMFGDVVNNPKYDGIPLGTICSTLSGGTPTTKVPEYYQGDIPWISTPYLGNNHINGSSAKAYITEDAIKNSATHLIPENTIMFGIRVGVGKSSIIDVPMCANQDIVALMGIDTNEYNLLFIKHTLDSYQSHFDSIKKGATILGITTEDLKKVLIPVVEMELQDQFAAFVEQTDKLKFDGIKIINLCEILKIKSWRRES